MQYVPALHKVQGAMLYVPVQIQRKRQHKISEKVDTMCIQKIKFGTT